MFGFLKSTPSKFTGHFLDPERGYYTSVITPDSPTDAKKLAELADGENIYFIVYYENGERVEQFVPASQKAAWEQLRRTNF